MANKTRAIAALLTARNVQEAAKLAGVSERTLSRWLAEPGFRAGLLTAEGDAIDAATRRLLTLQQAAIDTLEQVLGDVGAGPGVRLRAAQAVLEHMLRLREQRTTEERLTALEAAFHDNKH